MSEWEKMLLDFMVDPKDENATWAGESKNWCMAAALGGWDFSTGNVAPAGTTFWGVTCAPEGDDAGTGTDAAWARCYKADGPQEVMQDDGSMKSMNVIEFNTILAAITQEPTEPVPTGIWIGGQKHRINRKDIETGQNNEYSFTCVLLMRPGEKGFWAVSTDSSNSGKACVLLAEFDKSKNCTAAHAKIVALDFAKWLKESGTDKNF